MREVKFRAIPKNRYDEEVDSILDSIAFYTEGKGFDDTFVYGHLNGDYILGDTVDATEEYYNPSYWIKIDKDTIMQYTGLKDKNGREIYEGDIYSETEYRHGKRTVTYWKVVWNKLEYGFNLVANIEKQYRGEKYREDVYLPLRAINGRKMEYAGNIYENPELLKENG